MRKFLVVLAVLLLAVPAMAEFWASDAVLTAAGSVRLTTKLGSPVGPSLIDIATDGSAWVKFIWFSDACTDRADSTQIIRKLVLQVRDYTPPRSLYFPSGPDSIRVGLGTATEVIISR